MSTNVINDFESDATVQPRRKFGLVKTIVTPVKVQSGTSYTQPECFNRDGSPHLFKGKHLPVGKEKSNALHVILLGVFRRQDGTKYTAFRDYTSIYEDFKQILRPSLIKVFGATYGTAMQANTGKFIPMCIEEIPIRKFEGDDGLSHQVTTWSVLCNYDSEKTMHEQEHAYFSQFGDDGDSNGTAAKPAQNTSSIPAEILAQAKGIAAIPGITEENLKQVFVGAPYSQYPLDALLAAVKAR